MKEFSKMAEIAEQVINESKGEFYVVTIRPNEIVLQGYFRSESEIAIFARNQGIIPFFGNNGFMEIEFQKDGISIRIILT